MRLYRVEHDGRAHFALTSDDQVLTLFSDAPWNGGSAVGQAIPLAGAKLLAPVAPSKILCVGRNYAAHARELGNDVPKEPLLFLKPPSALCASGDAITLPRTMSERVEHEAEIGVVIGTRLKDATPEEARSGIYGITCVNDVTARDLQKKDVQFTRAKGFDGFCPVGPCVESEFDLENLAVTGRVNGQLRQHGHARDMVFPIAELVAFMSRVMTLEPGDLISTGTPEGVGPLVAGDTVEVEVSRVGVLRNSVA
jgi:2-keto-4-pentenoate hydratase/2-oxohepta-3-ene-1,7-dioic acid hydratase in catechol pathway